MTRLTWPYTRVILKRRNLQNIILSKRHPILYTNSNYMGAPKDNKGSKTTSQFSKAHLYPFKSSHIPLFPNYPHLRKRCNIPRLIHLYISNFSLTQQSLHKILLSLFHNLHMILRFCFSVDKIKILIYVKGGSNVNYI